jgi:hypothetical protein
LPLMYFGLMRGTGSASGCVARRAGLSSLGNARQGPGPAQRPGT